MEELTQTKLQQSRQLAEARQQLYTQERTGGEGGRGKVGRLEEELRTAQCELEKAREREKQVSGGLVSSPDFIRHVYHFQYNAWVRALGLGLETESDPCWGWFWV